MTSPELANPELVSYVHPVTRMGKRAADLITAIIGLIVAAPIIPVIMLAIRLESPGPILFRQLRIGESKHDHTVLFEMIKFRTMRSDAEAVSGAVWAAESDPRVTRVGRFLRKTRLDEIPQLINVLRGEMSLIGPRPERPGIFQELERAIPYYEERICGVRPGITGLAQVYQGYDRTIEDVRSKLLYDHAYAAALRDPVAWLMMDFQIVFRTAAVMVLGRGQ